MSRFEIRPTPLAGLAVVRRLPIGDARGSLERLYCSTELRDLLGGRPIAQINLTRTAAGGTVRGMHYQSPPHAETKVVTCLRGVVFDVAVDLRRGSPTFLTWHAEELRGDGLTTCVIPEGFAHGFQTLSDDCEMLYFHTAAYAASAEGGVHPMDPRLAIAWPAPVAALSPRDAGHPPLAADFAGIRL